MNARAAMSTSLTSKASFGLSRRFSPSPMLSLSLGLVSYTPYATPLPIYYSSSYDPFPLCSRPCYAPCLFLILLFPVDYILRCRFPSLSLDPSLFAPEGLPTTCKCVVLRVI